MVNEPPNTYKLGPGVLKIGAVGSQVDYARQVKGATVSSAAKADDDEYVLSGGVLAGDVEYTDTIAVEFWQDLGAADSIVELSWEQRGATLPLVYEPVDGKQVTGSVRIDPLDVGGDTMRKRPTSKVTWTFIGGAELGDA